MGYCILNNDLRKPRQLFVLVVPDRLYKLGSHSIFLISQTKSLIHVSIGFLSIWILHLECVSLCV